MIFHLLKIEKDRRYRYGGYFVRIFKEEHGTGWQVWKDDKFVYKDGQFIGLIDGGVTETDCEAYRSAEEYIDNCLAFQRCTNEKE